MCTYILEIYVSDDYILYSVGWELEVVFPAVVMVLSDLSTFSFPISGINCASTRWLARLRLSNIWLCNSFCHAVPYSGPCFILVLGFLSPLYPLTPFGAFQGGQGLGSGSWL